MTARIRGLALSTAASLWMFGALVGFFAGVFLNAWAMQ
jgi:hypothetical protein